MNKYRLLRDLPGLKAGAVFEKKGWSYVPNTITQMPFYEDKLVESSPEWFEKIEQINMYLDLSLNFKDSDDGWKELVNKIKSPEFIERYFKIVPIEKYGTFNAQMHYKIVPKEPNDQTQ